MITRKRIFGKNNPNQDAHKIYVICEGESDEPRYFRFFEGISNNLNVIIIPSEDGKTDPSKLKKMAEALFFSESPDYSLDYLQGDHVWFVVDTDAWEDEGKIAQLRDFCKRMNDKMSRKHNKQGRYVMWNIAQSNPCFEIWLYYHFYGKAPDVDLVRKAATFKQFVDSTISGGFNYDRDPVRLKEAISNADANFKLTEEGRIAPFATEMVVLGKEINSFVSSILDKLYNKLM